MRFKNVGLQYLRQALNDPDADFRDGQWEAIESLVVRKSRLLLVQRTGWGKSLVYFIATRFLREAGHGPTLLVSPLLSLMRNQIEMASRLGINAQTVNSSNSGEWETVYERLLSDKVDVLFISPERFANEEFLERVMPLLSKGNGLFTVDEAHCISDWGHDFRPDYMRIGRMLKEFPPGSPALAVTATANDRVVEDIVSQIGPDLEVIRGSLHRDSIRLQNIRLPSQAERMAWLSENLPKLPGSGVIYTLTVKDSDRVANWLRLKGHNVQPYHAGKDGDDTDRPLLEQKLLKNEVKALVATVALGMGFDKPDLGFVIHFQRPPSLVHYYQQIGRAGRAMDVAYGVLLSGKEDNDIADYFLRTALPPDERIVEVLTELEKANDGYSEPELMNRLNVRKSLMDKILKITTIINPSPVVKRDGRYYRTATEWKPNTDKFERLTAARLQEQMSIESYARSSECLMELIERELSDPYAKRCGVCANCVGEPLLPISPKKEVVMEAIEFLRQCDDPITPRKMWPAAISQTHDGFKGKISAELQAKEGRALCFWGDAGWGELVKRGKMIDGYFPDDLVKAMEEMIRLRWKPEPFPTWITCVSSLTKPGLVPEFTERLAAKLGLPFKPCVIKHTTTNNQKEMENSHFQLKNILDAFEVVPDKVLRGPVLLVDDMVDSGWTLTVIARLLRLAGAECVYPAALARVIGD